MNDRGLRLTSLDMLKSFLLSQVTDDDRGRVNRVWRSRLTALTDTDPNSNAQTAFVKSWLRAKHSAGSEDDEAIGTAFDKWVRKSASRIGLDGPVAIRDSRHRPIGSPSTRRRTCRSSPKSMGTWSASPGCFSRNACPATSRSRRLLPQQRIQGRGD